MILDVHFIFLGWLRFHWVSLIGGWLFKFQVIFILQFYPIAPLLPHILELQLNMLDLLIVSTVSQVLYPHPFLYFPMLCSWSFFWLSD